MSHSYYVLRPVRDPEAVSVDFSAVPHPERLILGQRLEAEWGGRQTLRVTSESFDASLFDFVDNEEGVLVVSPDVRALLEHNDVRAVEFLPVAIIGEGGAVLADDFVIANIRRLVDVVDHRRSSYAGDEEALGEVSRLVLIDEVQLTGPPLLRMAERPDLVLVRDDLLTALQAYGLAGLDYVPTVDFTG